MEEATIGKKAELLSEEEERAQEEFTAELTTLCEEFEKKRGTDALIGNLSIYITAKTLQAGMILATTLNAMKKEEK